MFCCEEVPVLLLLKRGRYKTITRTSIKLVKGVEVPVLVLPNLQEYMVTAQVLVQEQLEGR